MIALLTYIYVSSLNSCLFSCHEEYCAYNWQVVLFEDELADNGVSLLTVKVVTLQSLSICGQSSIFFFMNKFSMGED